MPDLIEIKVESRSLGNLSGIHIFVSKKLHDQLEKKKTQQGTMINSLKNGRALRGFKHLVETIKTTHKNARIIFTNEKTKKDGNEFFINFQEYQQKTSGRFFSLYRETGLDGAMHFLNYHFPENFDYDKARISASELKKVDRKFPEVIKELSRKTKNKKALFKQTTDTIKELKNKRQILKGEIEELEQIQNESNIFVFKKRIEELQERIKREPPHAETRGKNSWQNWIYKNNWLFGIHYQTAIEKEKVGFGNIPDFLFPTIDGFLDILEIKLPIHDVILKDDSHSGSYRWSQKASEAIGQVVNYLHQLELHQLEIQQKIIREYPDKYKSGIFSIKPRAFILISNKDGWNEIKVEALRKLNYSLHGIEVLTYTDLLNRGLEIVEMYNKKILE